MPNFTLRSLPVLAFFSASFGALYAQTNSSIIVVEAEDRRKVISAESQSQIIDFQHLKKDQTYLFTVPPDSDLGSCLPQVTLATTTAEFIDYDPAARALRFKAKSTVAQVMLNYPCSWTQDNPPRHYVSLSCVSCAPKKADEPAPDMAVLTVESAGVEELVKEVFIGGDCFDVTNISLNGGSDQIGKFFNGLTNVGFETGMIIATGDINVAPGPNDQNGAGGGGSGGGDGDLAAIATGAMFDVAVIEFDFTPTQTPLTFDYVFASEEYCEYVNTTFNDVFGFFISGPGFAGTQNLAVVPTTSTPITINTINHTVNAGLYANNTPAGLDNCENGGVCNCLPPQVPATGPGVTELQFDGLTRKMTAVANVLPCSTYHIKLAIADVGDGVWDSAVFLKAGSFDGGGNASIEWLVNGEPDVDVVTEGCGLVQLLVDRVGSNPLLPLPVSFTITGTATSGLDFSPIPFTIIIPAGMDQVLYTVNIINDLIPEGAETIIITLNSPCSCLHPQETLTILDYVPMVPTTDTITVCGPAGFGTVGVTIENGVAPYTYQWSNGSTDATISALVNFSTNFTVTVTDDCGKTKTAVARINVTPTPSAQLLPPAPQLCPNGGTATIQVNFNGVGPFELNYTLNGNTQDPIYDIHDDPYTLTVSQVGLYQIGSVIDSFGCPGTGAGAILVTQSTLALSGTVSNASCSTLTNGSINTTVIGGQGPYNYTWQGPSTIGNIPDPINILPGNYSVTVTDGFGCTNVQNFVVQSPPPLAPSATVQNVNCGSPNGGTVDLSVAGGNPAYTYIWTTGATTQDLTGLGVGTYTVTITDQTGCTKTNSATITGDFTPPAAAANNNGIITCTTTTLTLDGTGSSTGSNFTYLWTPGPGFIVSGNTTLNPVINQSGTYTIRVTNTANGCTSTATVQVQSNTAPPVTEAGPNGTLTCVVDTLTLNGAGTSTGPAMSYHWIASNGGTIVSGDSTLNPIVTSTGTYTLIVTNNTNGCTSTDNTLVNNNLVPPTATVAPGGQLTCTSPSILLNGNGSSTGPNFVYDWSSSTGGGISSGGNTLTPSVTAIGTYTLLVTNTTNGCTNTASTSVSSNSNVPVSLAVPAGPITCAIPAVIVDATGSSAGSNFTYLWGTANGQITSGQGTLQITAGAPGTYTLLVTNTLNNCTSSFSVDVTADVVTPVADAGSQVTLTCALPSSSLDGSASSSGPNFTYQWTAISGGNFVSATNIPNPQVDTAGLYQLLVTNTINGCTSTDQVLVLPDANDPVAQVATPGILNCLVSQIAFNTTGTSTGANIFYNWSGPGLLSNPTDLNALVNQQGNYTLVITNSANGCTSDITVNVPQNITAPPADAGPDLILNCYNPQQQIGGSNNPSGPNYSFAWSGAGIVSGANSASPIVNQSGTFTVTVTDTQNGCTQTDLVNLTADFVPPLAQAGPGFQLTCVQNSYTLQATASTGANFSYNWSTNTGSFTTATNILNPTVNGSGDYTLLVTNATNGCTTSASVQITQAADVPVALANNAPDLTCAITTLTLNGTGSSVGTEFSYLWTASNGGNIVSGNTSLNPVINQPGTYNLLVTNTVNNCTNNTSIDVGQNIDQPDIDAGASPTLTCTTTSLNLTGAVTTPGTFNYQWVAQNNGNITGGANSLTPTVNAGGTYLLTVTSQANGCTSTDVVTVNVDQAPPVTAIQQPATLTCTVDEINLNATGSSNSNMTHTWTTVGGHFVNQSNPLSPVVDAPGVYTLLITSTINGCTSSQTVTVPQDIQNPTAAAGTDGLLTCAVTTLQLNGNGSSQNGNYFYQWSTNDGIIQSGINSLTPTIVAGGTYTLAIVNNANGCTASDNVQVTVNTLPPVVAIATPGLITCTQAQVTLNGSGSQTGANISYSWATAGGNIVSGGANHSAVVSAAGQYTLTVLNNTNGCTSTQTVQVSDNIVLPLADAGPPALLTCTIEEVTLGGSGSTGANFSYNWSTTGGHIVSGSNGLQPLVDAGGVYTLLVTNINTGCTQTDQVIIDVETNIPTDFIFDLIKPTCHDNDGAITFESVAGGVGPYLYSINGGQNFSPGIDFAQIAPGSYTLWIQDANGCEYQEPLVVPQAPDPAISMDPSFSLELGDSLTLHALLPPGYPIGLIDTILWNPLEGLTFASNSLIDLLSPSAKPFKSTEYLVTLVSKDGCEAEDRVLIKVDNEPHVYIPNAFSPWLEDGENDVFLIFADGKQIVQVNKFQVYDRWGEMVFTDKNFQPNDPAHGWAGRLNNKLMDPAVFVYYAEIQLIDGRVLLYKGDVTLVR
jgi:hypothetical protein